MLVEIAGAGKYRLITRDSTIERDVALHNLLRSSGAQAALFAALTAGEEPDTRIFEAVAASGQLFELLGAALLPLDLAAPREHWLQRAVRWLLRRPAPVPATAWTPAMAAHTAETLRRVVAPAGKQLLIQCVVAVTTGFFLAGLHYLKTSPNYLSASGEGVRPNGGGSAVSSNSENGV